MGPRKGLEGMARLQRGQGWRQVPVPRRLSGPGQRQPAGPGEAGDLVAALLLCEPFVPLGPQPPPPMTSGLSADMTATGGGSLAAVHVSTLDLLRAHWPEIMSPMQVGGRNIRSGRLAFFSLLFLIH